MEDVGMHLISAFAFLFLLFLFKLQRSNKRNLPPSPPSLPIIGHLLLIKEPIHRTLQSLSDRYGPVLSLSFGSRSVVVISSPSAAEECFTRNDIILANRPRLLFSEILLYGGTIISVAPYGPHWRNLRRLTALKILSPHRLACSLTIRLEEVRLLVKSLYEVATTAAGGGGFVRVEMRSRLEEMSFNIIMRMISGMRCFGPTVDAGDVEVARQLVELIKETFELSGMEPSDFLPVLRRLVKFKGRERRMVDVAKRSDVILQGMIDELRSKRKRSDSSREVESKTMIDSMLLEGYSDDIIKGQILAMLSAGTDTTAVTIEWAMSLLLNHPNVMKKAQAELDDVIGRDRLANEADIHKLPYLQNIINEALRLFPPAPLLVPHESTEDCMIGGFNVPRGTMILVNAWAIQRDPKLWDEPTSFIPKRYEGLEDDHAYRLLPFGMGRRSCPGAGLANRVLSLALAALIQCFEWERIGEEPVDLSEGTGITVPKREPLEALCKVRECMIANVLTQL
ncbi:isoflavone 3'-hydroxylase-like [Eucalyptus grandis]|uniref:isoflavone 3'-hydroxylase-like n=1 Tax=Eucalyptus grandis TaxID=71139 RepID=UPI00192E9203|nr:isoflavone 3'-hydroxylase-like [Eucalyptus grandis]